MFLCSSTLTIYILVVLGVVNIHLILTVLAVPAVELLMYFVAIGAIGVHHVVIVENHWSEITRRQ